MSDKCCPRADVVSTHFEGCHTVHPECAAYKSGYEAGLRRAASCVAKLVAVARPQCEANYTDGDAWLETAENAILAEIKGE